MSEFSGSAYEGPRENEWFQGKGKFSFPNGTTYEGEMNKGEFHGEGTLIYPNGGRFVAKWERGKMIEGKYFFYDALEYKKENWDYCTLTNRQFYTEIIKGVRPDGLTLLTNDINGVKDIPEGTYDVGDGYYDPVKRAIFDYDGTVKRELEEEKEAEDWIKERCRYKPHVYDEDLKLTGDGDQIIGKMIELNTDPKKLEEYIELKKKELAQQE